MDPASTGAGRAGWWVGLVTTVTGPVATSAGDSPRPPERHDRRVGPQLSPGPPGPAALALPYPADGRAAFADDWALRLFKAAVLSTYLWLCRTRRCRVI